MKIKQIRIHNFRQLKKVELDLQESTTILAGPNNSGKTSFILLLKRLLQDGNFAFTKADINVFDKEKWIDEIKRELESLFQKEEDINIDETKNAFISKIIEDEIHEDKSIPKLTVEMQVDYNDMDDISNFADFIMNLSVDEHSIYFICSINLNSRIFIKKINDCWSRICEKWKLTKKINDRTLDLILTYYCECMEAKYFYTDEKYLYKTEISSQEFKELFNFSYIEAARPVDDSLQKDKHLLSDTLLALARKDEDWKKEVKDLPEKILDKLEETRIKETVEKNSLKALNTVINDVSETNGGHTGTLILDLEVDEKNIDNLISNSTNLKYEICEDSHNYYLGETTQGLGYSNLIHIHSKIEEFIKLKKNGKINFLVIEEPESHMHPQMQYVFAKKLLKQYDSENLQGLLTTHSEEIVRCINIEKLRVVREDTLFNSKIYDLSSFINNLGKYLTKDTEEEDTKLINTYKSFYENIGVSQLIFADKVVLFEGDTERLYLSKILQEDEYETLQQEYVAFIQVGGAYAYTYKCIIEFLKIKTLIITDLDYSTDVKNKKDLLNSTTTNETIKNFYNDTSFSEVNPKPEDFTLTIEKVYKWLEKEQHIVSSINKTDINDKKIEKQLIYLATQTSKDHYARTLEAAMLGKQFKIDGFAKKRKITWTNLKKGTSLKFVIPSKKQLFSLIDILESTSGKKTDFMFSVILGGYSKQMLPNYIEEGLKWLMK